MVQQQELPPGAMFAPLPTSSSTDATLSPGRKNSVEFIAGQYDGLNSFRKQAMNEISIIKKAIDFISERCEELCKSIESMESYSYQYNVKIIGLPLVNEGEHEDSETTSELCLKLFKALGVEDINMGDIDIAHRVPSRKKSSRPDPIICKFVRRLAKEKVMKQRKMIPNIACEALGYHSDVSIDGAGLYDHLTPRLQSLLNEAKAFKTANNFQFCWTRNGVVLLRESDHSRIIKLSSVEDLMKVKQRYK